MYRPLSLFVGLRYTRSRRRNHFISFISLISTLGIALGVIVLITVLSVMNGFHKEVRESIQGMASHVDVQAMNGRHLRGRVLRVCPAKSDPVPEGRSGCTCDTPIHTSLVLYPDSRASDWGTGFTGGRADTESLPVRRLSDFS